MVDQRWRGHGYSVLCFFSVLLGAAGGATLDTRHRGGAQTKQGKSAAAAGPGGSMACIEGSDHDTYPNKRSSRRAGGRVNPGSWGKARRRPGGRGGA